MNIKKNIPLLFLYIIFCSFFSFQHKTSIKITSKKVFEQRIAYFKDKLLKHYVDDTFPENTKELLEQSIIWAKNNETKEQLILSKILLIRYFEEKRNYIEVISKSNELLRDTAVYDHRNVIEMLESLQDAYNKTEQYNELLESYTLYYQLFPKFNIPFRKLSQAKRIAMAYYRLHNYPKALEYFKESEVGCIEEKNYFLKSGANNNIGLCFLEMNQLDSASYYFKKSIRVLKTEYISKLADKKKIKNANSFLKIVEANIASIQVKKGNYNKVLPFLLRELESSKKEHDNNTKRQAYYKIAEVFYLKHQPKIALKYIDSTLSDLLIFKNRNLKEQTLFLKAKSLLKAGRVVEADFSFKVVAAYKRKLLKEQLQKRYTLATVKHETKKRELELIESKQKNILDQATKKYQKSGLMLLGLVLIGTFFFLRKTLKNKKEIHQQKEIAENASKEKEILLKEVHHRVKNNLQVISSILELQSLKYNNKEFSNIMQVGQNRIQAISLIHQQLYQSDSIKKINFKKYVKTLISYIKAVNAEVTKPINFHLQLLDFMFPITTAVPLGLIVNELITNAYKHAFESKLNGNITIKMLQNETYSYTFIVADDGIGFSKNIETLDSTGLKLVQIISKQIGGKMEYKTNNGSQFIITFKDNVAV